MATITPFGHRGDGSKNLPSNRHYEHLETPLPVQITMLENRKEPHHQLPMGDPPPAFGCVVYVRQLDSGGVFARVANLPGLQVEAENERAALTKLVPEFRKRMGEATEANLPSPLIDPPEPIRDGESRRFLPVHL